MIVLSHQIMLITLILMCQEIIPQLWKCLLIARVFFCFFFCCVHYSVTDSTVLPSSQIKAYQNGICDGENAELIVLIPANNVSDAHIK